jgi:hypothetical protein
VRWGLLLLLTLATACHRYEELNASEAISAGDAELAKELPQMKHHLADANAQLRGGKWHIEYGGGTGGATVDVDSHTGRAHIVKIEQ